MRQADVFDTEAAFEDALVDFLSRECGWKDGMLVRPTEKDLIANWAQILFENNRGIDQLDEYPLTEGEMQQILAQVAELRTPLQLSAFINGRDILVKRDNAADARHFGKEVRLHIYDRMEIAGGKSRYQIARQPIYATDDPLKSDRRGDLLLLINGMPLIGIELKKSGIPLSQAVNQIQKYIKEHVYTGILSLVQLFAAMKPEETLYFASPGPGAKVDPNYCFHWADFNNEPVNDWAEVARTLLSIPLAHQMIGFYTVADRLDGVLKVMRSYQYYAANRIADAAHKHDWTGSEQRGGFIWHTTGSGKTMTSFKTAELIAAAHDADKVVFLVDRIELATQSLKAYRHLVTADMAVAQTEDSEVLASVLESDAPSDTLIVTSIQKMGIISGGKDAKVRETLLSALRGKRIVFIVDECHRSTFGDTMADIKKAFPHGLFFGFTGTPIHEENLKKGATTADVFGSELHRYSIADGIRDGNVLGFDPYKVLTYRDKDVRREVGLAEAKAQSEEEVYGDPVKRAVYEDLLHRPMAGHTEKDGTYVKGVEDFLPDAQYMTEDHRRAVVRDILEHWMQRSSGGRMHAIFATSSIREAIEYYRLFKALPAEEGLSPLRVSALFDPSVDNEGYGYEKEEGLAELVADYNALYGQKFTIPSFAEMKKDISARLAHKMPYNGIEKKKEQMLDLLIVVDQMLTGFDSKWLNTLYLDKMLRYEGLIQAFSRTNRLFGKEKSAGTIVYYRRPHTMEQNIKAAVKLYSGDKPFGLFADKLPANLRKINETFADIRRIFEEEGIEDFREPPKDETNAKKFVSLMRELTDAVEAAKVQGFVWDTKVYDFREDESAAQELRREMVSDISEAVYKTLVVRYKEIVGEARGAGSRPGLPADAPFDIDPYITEIDTDDINVEYMNSRFEKYLKELLQGGLTGELTKAAETELHRCFASLSQEEQRFAELILHDIQSGDFHPEEGKRFHDYITEYRKNARNTQADRLVLALGVDRELLLRMLALHPTEKTIGELGRFAALKKTVDKARAKAYFEALEGKKMPLPKVNIKADSLLRAFLLAGGMDIELPKREAYGAPAQEMALAAEGHAPYGEEK